MVRPTMRKYQRRYRPSLFRACEEILTGRSV